jgi:hypothetical protein
MSPLRRRMIDDMQIRNLTPNTQRVYVAQVVRFACHFRKSPELGPSTDWGDHVESDEIGRVCCRLGTGTRGWNGRCVWLGRGLTVSLEISR